MSLIHTSLEKHNLKSKFDIFDEIKGEADTLAGLILEIKGQIPKKNETLNYLHFTFKIISVDSRRIKKIEVTLNDILSDRENYQME